MTDEIAGAVRELAAGGVPSPQHDARELAAHVLGVRPGRLLGATWTAAQRERFGELVSLRAARVPLQHLTGVAGFRYLDLAVGPGVFVPRPETELLAGWAVEQKPGLVVDLCTGSGAIALAVATEAGATVHAVDVDPQALAWAERNARGRVTLHRGDVADETLLAELDGTVDVVTANPPYIPDGSYVEPEVAEHDPAVALWGGADGLVTVRAVERAAARLLRPGGWVGIEHADKQGEAVPAVLARTGRWDRIEDHPDLAGRPRFTTARKTWPAPASRR